MAKAVKLKNNLFLASTSIVHKRGGGWHYLSDLLDNIYPIGSIHITTNNVNPSTYFGGTWEKITGGFLYGCKDSISNMLNDSISHASFAHTLTIDQIPSHGHGWNSGTSSTFETLFVTNAGGWSFPGSTSGYGFKGGYASIGNNGGGKGHQHDIPHIGVYVWKRTA